MRLGAFVFAALAVSVLLAVLVSPFASSSPDGLERVAEDKGFLDKADESPAWSLAPAPDYAVPGVAHSGVGTALAGLLGTLLTFGAAWALAKAAARRKERAGSESRP